MRMVDSRGGDNFDCSREVSTTRDSKKVTPKSDWLRNVKSGERCFHY